MALFDFFKKIHPPAEKPKKEKAVKKEVEEETKKEKKPLEKKKEVRIETPLPSQILRSKTKEDKPIKKVSANAYKTLRSPHVTEKATMLGEDNKYVFKVWPRTNKVEIKKVVEDTYGVNVVDVNIINVPKRKRRLGGRIGWRKGYKKAIVKIKEGQKIEILPR